MEYGPVNLNAPGDSSVHTIGIGYYLKNMEKDKIGNPAHLLAVFFSFFLIICPEGSMGD